jgi:hypothetical protein
VNEICFGPFIVKSRAPAHKPTGLVPANLAIEFSTEYGGYSMDLYYKHDHSDGFMQHWHEGIRDFYIHHSQLCREVTYSLRFSRNIDGHLFLPLEAVLLPLYRKFRFHTHVLPLLAELREAFGNPLEFPWRHQNLLNEKATALGYRSTRLFDFGRKLDLSLEWAPLIDHGKPSSVSVSLSHIVFTPGPGRTLGSGKWAEFRKDSGDHIELLLRPAVKKIGDPPIKLISPKGVEKLMADFKWTPASLLPRAELAIARKEFLLSHRDLWSDVTALAKALIAEGLYPRAHDLSPLKRRLRTLLPTL